MDATTRTARLALMLAVCGLAVAPGLAQITVPSNVPTTPPPPTTAPPATAPSRDTKPAPAATPETRAGTVDLRPKFRAGQQIRYVLDQNSKNSMHPQDSTDASADEAQKQTQRIGLVMKVVQAGDEGATIQVVYESIKVTLTTPDGVAEYDSTKPPAKPASKPGTTPTGTPPAPRPPNVPSTQPSSKTPAQPAIPSTDPLKEIGDMDMGGMLGLVVGPMVGTTITVKTDRAGAITSVSGGDALGGGVGALGGMGGMGGAMVPNPTSVANWLVAGVGGPNNSGMARVGESWTNNDALAGTPVGSFSMKTTHTLKSATGGSANIAFVGGIEPNSQGAAPGGIAQVQSAAYSGSYVWDTRSGALAEMGTDMRIVLDANALGNKTRMTSETQMKVRRQ